MLTYWGFPDGVYAHCPGLCRTVGFILARNRAPPSSALPKNSTCARQTVVKCELFRRHRSPGYFWLSDLGCRIRLGPLREGSAPTPSRPIRAGADIRPSGIGATFRPPFGGHPRHASPWPPRPGTWRRQRDVTHGSRHSAGNSGECRPDRPPGDLRKPSSRPWRHLPPLPCRSLSSFGCPGLCSVRRSGLTTRLHPEALRKIPEGSDFVMVRCHLLPNTKFHPSIQRTFNWIT